MDNQMFQHRLLKRQSFLYSAAHPCVENQLCVYTWLSFWTLLMRCSPVCLCTITTLS